VSSVAYGLGQFVVVMGVVIGLVMLEPDLGTSILLMTVGLAMFFVGGAQIVHFFGLLVAGGGAFLTLALSAPYRRERLLAFLDPESNVEATGWHLLQARLAFGSGGIFGIGLGESRQKFTWLPAPHNDAIFAIIGEELGLIGCAFVLGLFFLVGYRGYRIARRAPDQFGMLVGVGVTTWLIFQAVFNIGGITAAIPFTGITLPFISYGGSSLVISMTAVGILLNISKQTRRVTRPVVVTYQQDATALRELVAIAPAVNSGSTVGATRPFLAVKRTRARQRGARGRGS
jgi:cell division protein FtsW